MRVFVNVYGIMGYSFDIIAARKIVKDVNWIKNLFRFVMMIYSKSKDRASMVHVVQKCGWYERF